MSNRINISLSGTSRKMRLLPALDPNSVQPFDHTSEDLLFYLKEYAGKVQYYNDLNEPDGDWNQFLEGNLDAMARYIDDPDSVNSAQKEQFSRPHVALMLSFLKLLRYAQQSFNQLPKRHLDYYYKQVLQLQLKKEKPDSVNLLFYLNEGVHQHVLTKGSKFMAGEDLEGNPLTYTLDHEIIVNRTKVVKLYNLLRAESDKVVKLFKSDAPALITAIPDPEVELNRWKTFGQSKTGNEAQLGVLITSPLLAMQEGIRKIKIALDCAPTEINKLRKLFKDVKVLLSTENGMRLLNGNPDAVVEIESKDNLANTPSGFLHITLNQNFPAIVVPEQIPDTLPPSKWPMLQFIWNDHQLASGMNIKGMSLSVDVKGLTTLSATNTLSALDTSKPFLPFSGEPAVGTEFKLTHADLQAKRPDAIKVNFDWSDGNPGNSSAYKVGGTKSLEDYYQLYKDIDNETTTPKNTSTLLNDLGKVSLELLEPAQLPSVSSPLMGIAGSLSQTNIVKTNAATKIELAEKIDVEKLNQYRRVSVVLRGNGFLFEKYPLLETRRLELAANEKPKVKSTVDATGTEYAVSGLEWTKKILPPVHVPKLKGISLDYTASVADTDKDLIQCYSLHPFGYTGPHLAGDSELFMLSYEYEGEFYIGLEGLQPPQHVSVLFQLSEGSAIPEAPTAEIKWSFLHNNKWLGAMPGKISNPLILSDDTNGLLQSGIIRFDFPSGLTSDSTLMPRGLFWLRASVAPKYPQKKQIVPTFSPLLVPIFSWLKPSQTGKLELPKPGEITLVKKKLPYQSTDSVSDLLAIHAQSAKATFENNGNAGEHLLQPLKAGTIKELQSRQDGIEKIIQPYSSFGGRPLENDLSFYTRVAERLRHKNRALTIWDYERIVLENFPEIHKVRCTMNENEPGLVTLVVIPDIRLQHPFAPFEPKAPLRLLKNIENFILQRAPSYATVQVKNPSYSRMKLDFDVKFKMGYDPGHYLNILQDTLKRYLSPWAYEEGANIEFDQTIYVGALAFFIEQQVYVDFITSLNLYRLNEDGVVEASASKNLSLGNNTQHEIWVSSQEHFIRLIETDLPEIGLGTMRVEYDFQLANVIE